MGVCPHLHAWGRPAPMPSRHVSCTHTLASPLPLQLLLPAPQALLLTEHLLRNSSQHVVQTIIDAIGVMEGLKQFK